MPFKTVAICDGCYAKEYPGRVPVRMRNDLVSPESCCMCGNETVDGIYVRREVKA